MTPINLWLDDIRLPPEGWVWVKNVPEAIKAILYNQVEEMSLDHDLGACEACMEGKTVEEWMVEHEYQSMPHCNHLGTGTDLLDWMEEWDVWPEKRPTVHSANPVGRARMEIIIAKKWGPK